MFDGQVLNPQAFVEALREFQGADPSNRGGLANTLSDLIITKRVDLAEVRLLLADTGANDLLDTLDRLIALIEPYIEEGGVEE